MDKLLEGEHEVVAWNRSKDVLDGVKLAKGQYIENQKLKIAYGFESLRDKLLKPRIFWLMLPSGETTEFVISEIEDIAEPGDIVIDGANSNFKDSQRHFEELEKKSIKFLDIGVSGGIHGVKDGFCLMVGGNKDVYDYVKPALDSLVKPEGGHNYFGTAGAGHFVKMVHNGIEYGMMQALAEGFGVLEKSPYSLNLIDVGAIWQRGSIIRSFLLDMAVNAFVTEPDFVGIEGYIDATGEGKWTVEQAEKEHVPVDAIKKAYEFRMRSQYDKAVQDTLAAKLVAALRKQFGGHELRKT